MSLRRPVLAAVAALALVGAAGCSSDSVLDLEVGDCLNQSDLDGDEISSAEAIDCDEEHDAEIFAEHGFTGDEYPGVDAVREQSEAGCVEQFDDFVGMPYLESELNFTMLYPSETSWNDADDRATLCILQAPEPMTGSLEGAAI
jgi:hypothetical protein